VRLAGDLGQFGNDFLLLGQIESHCTPPYCISAFSHPLEDGP
jgi:hypothetical protein